VHSVFLPQTRRRAETDVINSSKKWRFIVPWIPILHYQNINHSLHKASGISGVDHEALNILHQGLSVDQWQFTFSSDPLAFSITGLISYRKPFF
jgi:hypothetical protein